MSAIDVRQPGVGKELKPLIRQPLKIGRAIVDEMSLGQGFEDQLVIRMLILEVVFQSLFGRPDIPGLGLIEPMFQLDLLLGPLQALGGKQMEAPAGAIPGTPASTRHKKMKLAIEGPKFQTAVQ